MITHLSQTVKEIFSKKKISFYLITFSLIFLFTSFDSGEFKSEIIDYKLLILPDTLYEDSTLVFEAGDTIEIYTSGADSIFILYEEPLPDSMENAWVVGSTNHMLIELTEHHLPVNEGVYGVNLTDFFEDGHAQLDDNTNYTSVPDPWQALIDIQPKTIRIFSGSGSKFMHVLGYYDDDIDMTYGGYGYNWKEIVNFYGITDADGLGDEPPLTGLLSIQANMDDDGECDDCGQADGGWMADAFVKDFEEFYKKFDKQLDDLTTFDPTDPVSYTHLTLPTSDLV